MPRPAAEETIRLIPVDRIRPGPHQARRVFSDAGLDELAESIRASGLVQPVVLRSDPPQGFSLLAGERRWRAAQRAGLQHIPSVVRDDLAAPEAFVLGLVENLQRESLTPIETAEGLARLAQLSAATHDALARRIGKSRVYVSNMLRLLQLVAEVRAQVDAGLLSAGHAKVLAGLPPSRQPRWADAAIAGGWSVRELERRLLAERPSPPSGDVSSSDADRLRLERELADLLGCRVQLRDDGGGRGELRLAYHDLDELDGLLRRLGYREQSS